MGEPVRHPGAFTVRAEFDRPVIDVDFLLDLAGNPTHRLMEFRPQVTTNDDGRAQIELLVPAVDVWTSILTAMTVIRQSGYDPAALHVTRPNLGEQPGLAA